MAVYVNYTGDYTAKGENNKPVKVNVNNNRYFESAVPYAEGVTRDTIKETLKGYDNFSNYNFGRLNDVYDLTKFNPDMSYQNSMFEAQRGMWEKLERSIGSQSTHIYAFDFETLGILDVNNLSTASAITEFGVADIKVHAGSNGVRTIEPVRHASFAFGINEKQVSAYLDELDMMNNIGFDNIKADMKTKRTYMSDMERLSRYSGNVKSVYEISTHNITKQKAMVVRKLADSSWTDSGAVMSGIMNEFILGGGTKEQMEELLKDRYSSDEVKHMIDVFASKQKDFSNSGFMVQGQDSPLIDKIKGYILKRVSKDNQVVSTYNGNIFDIPYFNNVGTQPMKKLRHEDTIDIYSAIQHVTDEGIVGYNSIADAKRGNINIPGRMRQEGMAALYGIDFADSAHNAGSDSLVTATLAVKPDFMDDKSLGQVALAKAQGGTEWNYLKKGTYLYANKSMFMAKDGTDGLIINGGVASDFYNTGIKRGRYYTLNNVMADPKGGVVAKFSAAAKTADEVFYKHFDSQDELAEAIRRTFTPDSQKYHGTDKMSDVIQKHEEAYWADYARRNYDRYFNIDSISIDKYTGKTKGGWEELNKYYQAYKNISAFDVKGEGVTKEVAEQAGKLQAKLKKFDYNIGNTGMSIRDKVAASNEYDDFFKRVLIDQGFGYSSKEGMVVSDNVMRNFKNFLGKFHDEKEFFEFMNENFKIDSFKGKDIDKLRMQTLVAGGVRDEILKRGTWDADSNVPNFKLAMTKDLYAFDIDVKDPDGGLQRLTIDFGRPDADTNLYNLIKGHASKFDGNLQYKQSLVSMEVVDRLKEKGVISEDFYIPFAKEMDDVDVAVRQNWRYAFDISAEVHKNFVDPMREKKWNVSLLRKLEDENFVPDGFDEKLVKIARGKIKSYTGEHMATAHATRNPMNTAITLGKVLVDEDNFEDIKNAAKVIKDNASKMTFSLGYDSGEADKIIKHVQQYLGYDDAAAKQVGRMFTLESGRNSAGRSLNSLSNAIDKTAYMTGFFHSNVKGEDAFVVISKRDSMDRIIRDMSRVGKEDFSKAMEGIGKEGRAAVLKLPAIHEYIPELRPGYLDNLFTYTDMAETKDGYKLVKKNISYKTMTIGDNWEVISRQRFNVYNSDFKGPLTLKNMRMVRTDDAQQAVNWFMPTFEHLKEELERTDIPDSEKYSNITKHINRFIGKKKKDMPAPSGSLNSIVNSAGKTVAVQVPNSGDLLKSAQLDMTQMERVFMMMVKRDYELGDMRMGEAIKDIIGAKVNKSDSTKNVIEAIDKILSGYENKYDDYGLSGQAAEMFRKSLVLPFSQQGFGDDLNFTVLEYMDKFATEHADEVHKSIRGNIKALLKDYQSGQLTGILSESAVKKGYISLVKLHEVIPGMYSDASMRPTFSQALTPKIYDPEVIEREVGKDVLKRYNITLDFDGKPLGLAQEEFAFRNFEIGNTGRKLGKFKRGMGMETRLIDSVKAYQLLEKVRDNIAGEFSPDDIANAKWVAKYRLDSDIAMKLLQESANAYIDSGAYNVYESRMAANPLIFNNSYFSKKYVHKAQLSDKIEDKAVREKLADFMEGKLFTDGDNIAKLYNDATGETLKKADGTDLVLRYKSNVDGKFTGGREQIMQYLEHGRGKVIQELEGIRLEKLLVGNEKGMVSFLEWDGMIDPNNPINRIARILDGMKLTDEAKREITLNALGDVWEKSFGKGVAILADHPLGKHLNSNTLAIHDRILMAAYMTKDETAYNEIQQLYKDAAESLVKDGMFGRAEADGKFVGLRIEMFDGQPTTDSSFLKKGGATLQIERAAKLAMERAKQNDAHYVYKNIADSFDYAMEHNLIRMNVSVIEDNESIGNSKTFNARLGMSLRMQDFNELVGDDGKLITKEEAKLAGTPGKYNAIDVNGEKVFVSDYFADAVYKRAFKGQKADVRSVGATIAGIEKAVSYLEDPRSLNDHTAAVLELSFENLTFTRNAGETVEDIMEYGIFKNTHGKVTSYGKTIERAAANQGIQDLSLIQAIKVKLPNGVKYEHEKQVFNDIIIPVYEIQQYKNDFVRTDSIKSIQSVMNTIQTYGKSLGTKEQQKKLNERIDTMYLNMQKDYMLHKDSYFSKRIVGLEIPGTATFKSESINVPMIKGIADNPKLYDQWVKDSKYREEVIDAVRKGVVTPDKVKYLGFETEGLALMNPDGSTYSRIIDGKMRYDAISEASEEGFRKKLGVDFTRSGYEILHDSDGYEELSMLGTGKGLAENITDLGERKTKMRTLMDSIKKSSKEAKGLKDRDLIDIIIDNDDAVFKRYGMSSSDTKQLSSLLQDTTRDYLEKVGAFGYTARDPLFQPGSAPVTITRLNRSLAKDEMRLSPIIALLMNDDNDGDTPNGMIFIEDKGTLTKSRNKEWDAFKRKYEARLYRDNYSNGEILANIMADQADAIAVNGGLVNDAAFADGTYSVYSKAKRLDKAMSSADIDEMLVLLREDGAEFTVGKSDEEVADYINDLIAKPQPKREAGKLVKEGGKYSDIELKHVEKIYEAWDAAAGNFKTNTFMNASAVKARYIKSYIGHISVINYSLNEQMLNTQFDIMKKINAGDITDPNAMKELKRIRRDLILDNTGFLVEVEQKAIDVKHVRAGLTISDTPEYKAAIQSIFNGSRDVKQKRLGLANMYKALQGNKAFDTGLTQAEFVNEIMGDKAYEDLSDETVKRVRSLIDLSNIFTDIQLREVNSKITNDINTLKSAEAVKHDINAIINDANSASNFKRSPYSPMGMFMRTLKEQNEVYEIGYNHFDGVRTVKRQLLEDAVYMDTSMYPGAVGAPRMYRYTGYKKDGDIYKLNFDMLDPQDLKKINKKYLGAGEEATVTIAGTVDEVAYKAGKRFGEFRGFSLNDLIDMQRIEYINDEKIVKYDKIFEMQKDISARRFLKMRVDAARENKEALSYRDFINIRGDKNILREQLNEIEEFLKKVESVAGDANQYIDFENNLRYIKEHNIKGRLNINNDVALNHINEQIIAAAKNKKTSTSSDKFLEDYYRLIGYEAGLKEDLSKVIKDLGNTVPVQGSDFSGFFDDALRHDISLAQTEYAQLAGDFKETKELKDHYQSIINRYKTRNIAEYESVWGGDAVVGKIPGKALSFDDVDTLFGYDSKKLGDMRVGFDITDEKRFFGRKFNTLSEYDMNYILGMQFTGNKDDIYLKYAHEKNAQMLRSFRDTEFSPDKIQHLQGLTDKDMEEIRRLSKSANDYAFRKGDIGAEQHAENARRLSQDVSNKAKQISKDKPTMGDKELKKTLGVAWEKMSDFVKEHKKGVGIATAAILGLSAVNGFMNRTSTPLAPEITASRGDNGIGRGKKLKSREENTVYANPSDGLNYKMSASSANKVNAMQTAQLNNVLPGGSNVNIYDSRKPVSDSWLQDKVAAYI